MTVQLQELVFAKLTTIGNSGMVVLLLECLVWV